MFLSAFSDPATVEKVKQLGAVAYLVKPLDIRQIVPAVEAAFATLPARDPSASRSSRPMPLSAAGDPLANTVALAVGVVMHRYSLSRHEALRRLTRLAAADGLTLEAQSQRLLEAAELLARPGAT